MVVLNKKTLCFITSHYGIAKNGPGTFADYFVKKVMEQKDFKLIVISTDDGNSKYGEEVIKINQRKYFGSTFISAIKIKNRILKLNKKMNIDYIYFNTFRLALFSTKINIPILININDYYFAQMQNSFKTLKKKIYYNFWKHYYEKILNSAKMNFVNSNFTLKQILKNNAFDEKNFYVTYKGINLNLFNYNYVEVKDKINLLFVGSDFNRKGLDNIIEALYYLKTRNNKLGSLFVIGEDKKSINDYKQMVDKYNMQDNVIFLGRMNRSDVNNYHDKSHVYIMPSTREALGVSIIEASASGTTVIASDKGGIPEVIETEKEGLLLPECTPEALYSAICRLVDNSEFRKKITEAAHIKSEQFSFDNIYTRIVKDIK
ncbi:MAG: hypothetical protein B6229_00530 [Spirochaetaceae bacterium 4572_7]|nr:MAG: hypothetical protein B6229_00530 [Spirochaetaceae bacterium 4572_7]